jgi:Tfp pilus assembly protein PilN
MTMADINLIPPEWVAKRRSRTRLRLWAVVCIVYVVGLVTAVASAYVLWNGGDAQLEHDLAATKERLGQTNQRVLQMRREVAQATTALQAGRVVACQPDWSKLLTMVSANLGDEVVLTTCRLVALDRDRRDLVEGLGRQTTPASLPQLLADGAHQLQLSGFGRSQTAISNFILRLEKLGLFASTRRLESNRKEFLGSDAIAFSVECTF